MKKPSPVSQQQSKKTSTSLPVGVSRKSLILIGLMTLAVLLLAIATIYAYTDERDTAESGPIVSADPLPTSDADLDSVTLSPNVGDSIYEENLRTLQENPPEVPDEYLAIYASLLGSLQEYPELMDIFYHMDDYPLDMLTMLVNYKETLQTVLDYPTLQGTYDPTLTQEELDGFAAGEAVSLIQWDERWAYYPMFSSLLCWAGCGPTTLSMAYMALTGDTTVTPDVMAQLAVDHGYYVEGQGSGWNLFSEGAVDMGLSSTTLPLSEGSMKTALDEGALIVVNFGPGDFTTSGHYALIVGYDDSGFQINDPNSQVRTAQRWSYEQLESQIKNLWKLTNPNR